MSNPRIAIIVGSDSDLPAMEEGFKVLRDFAVPFELKVLSAHRSPALVHAFVKSAVKRRIKIIIAAAGGAAHLAGVIASLTRLPVIGVPMETKSLRGIDSLLSTVQMPSGVPVATMAIGRAGAKNAAIFAIQILALTESKTADKLESFKKKLSAEVAAKNASLRRQSPK
jgi:5-(carboxyamino)imidazole ribonucleotide mutase